MSNFGIFYDARSPNMAMSRDPRSKLRRNFIFPNSAFNIGKVTKFPVEKLSTSETVSQKPHRGGLRYRSWYSPIVSMLKAFQASFAWSYSSFVIC